MAGRIKLPRRAQDVVAAARGLAIFELSRARRLASQLPTTSTFEEHSDVALSIGACGRRIELLLPAFLKLGTFHTSIAPVPPAILEADAETISVEELIRRAVDETSELRYLGYDLHWRLVAMSSLPRYRVDAGRMLSETEHGDVTMWLAALSNATLTTDGTKPTRGRRAPDRHAIDSRWTVCGHDDALPRMPRLELEDGLVHKLHNTAFRETVASEVAALNLLEYDHLPWAFYIDMARQCEDEARHALITADALRKRAGELGKYPVSYLGNFYEAFWEMTLVERFVAMNIDIEAIGQPYLADVSRRLDTVDEDAAQLYDFISTDEMRHARMGARWLEYLYPDIQRRHDILEACRGLLLVNLASAHASIVGGKVADAFERWSQAGSLFTFETARTVDHEPEITPLLARRGTNAR